MSTIYQALSPSHFRLLRICGLEEASSIQCTTEQHNLSDPPGYSAVSYTWGEAENLAFREQTPEPSGEDADHEIQVNGQPFSVTQNLYDLLCQNARSYPRDVNYWIDAICINQDDIEEKTQQVNAMDQIYSRAFSVIVWLGKENNHTAKVIDMVNHLGLAFTEEYNLHGHCRKYAALNDPEDEDQMRELKLSNVSRTDWLAFIAFFQRRWFFRVWTVQEAALAQRLLVRVGQLELEWMQIVACGRLIGDTGLLNALLDMGQRHFRQYDIAFPAITFFAASALVLGKADAMGVQSSMAAWYGVENVHSSNAALLDLLLKWMSNFLSTDPRDRVFAVVGMLNVIARNHTQLPFPLAADYSRTTADVYTDTMVYLLDETMTLTILSRVTPPSLANVSNLPSWVIDFSNPGSQRFLDLHRVSQKGVPFDASGGRKKEFHCDARQLHVHAMTIAKISHVGDSSDDLADRNCFEQTAALALTSHGTGKEHPAFIDRIWKAMTCDLNELHNNNDATDDELRCSFGAMLVVMRLSTVVFGLREGRSRADVINEAACQNQLGEIDKSGTAPSKGQIEEYCERLGLLENTIGNVDIGVRDELVRNAQAFNLLIKRTMASRRVFRTNGGHIGLGSLDCRPGDDLCVIADGGRTPFIVRERASADSAEHVFLGEAYVREIMHGEAVEDLEAQGSSWRSICLV